MRWMFTWLSRWPLWLLHATGAGAGWLVHALSPSYRRRLRHNADLAGVSAADRLRAVREAGKLALEVPWVWLRPDAQPVLPLVQWRGEAAIEQAIARGRGLVLLTPHMGSFEVAGRALAERFGPRQPMTVLYRPARQAWLRALEAQARARPHMATAPASLGGVRLLLRALRRGETVGLLPDQVPPHGQGVWAPFFGQPAYTMTLAARLVQQTGAALAVLWCERLPRAAGYCVHVQPMALDTPPAGVDDDAWAVACATQVNRTMEALIAQCPAQYLWGYHRYKQPRREAAEATGGPP